MIPDCKSFRATGFLARLGQDRAGNTLAMIAAGLFPLLALVGGGVDMGRSYLSQSRLQQACDAAVLAARKKLGSQVVTDGDVPADIATIGNRFFNLNFRDGSYGTDNRAFEMTLEEDYAISGAATVDVPTTIMTLFGYNQMPISVKCEAQLNFSNTDIMFVLDSTASMNEANTSDSLPRIEILRTVVQDFHTQLEGSRSPGTTVRYGFVPYSTNVNVGHLLRDEWVVDNWSYQSREDHHTTSTPDTDSDSENWVQIVDGYSQSVVSSYAATWHDPVPGTSSSTSGGELGTTSGGGGGSPGYYSCEGALPDDTFNHDETLLSTVTEPYDGPPAGTKTIERYRHIYNGDDYWSRLSGSTCNVIRDSYNNDTWEFDWITVPDEDVDQFFRYASIPRSVVNWRTETNGCIEERATYEIDDWDNVDFTRALDLDIDLVPTSDDDTKWRPQYPGIIWERSLDGWDESDQFTVHPVISDDDFFQPSELPSLIACPTAALNLAPMDTGEINSYLGSIVPRGTTYHDIGLIWGARLLSPTGLFATENAGDGVKPTSRHLIFLTDGKTETFDIAYGAYGVEPLDQRRWRSTADSGMDLDEVVERRFSVVCEEVKKRNITVWVIGFGVGLEDFMKNCAGHGHHFEAADAGELGDVFSTIATQLGDLRISK